MHEIEYVGFWWAKFVLPNILAIYDKEMDT
jgi:hypothetical protein